MDTATCLPLSDLGARVIRQCAFRCGSGDRRRVADRATPRQPTSRSGNPQPNASGLRGRPEFGSVRAVSPGAPSCCSPARSRRHRDHHTLPAPGNGAIRPLDPRPHPRSSSSRAPGAAPARRPPHAPPPARRPTGRSAARTLRRHRPQRSVSSTGAARISQPQPPAGPADARVGGPAGGDVNEAGEVGVAETLKRQHQTRGPPRAPASAHRWRGPAAAPPHPRRRPPPTAGRAPPPLKTRGILPQRRCKHQTRSGRPRRRPLGPARCCRGARAALTTPHVRQPMRRVERAQLRPVLITAAHGRSVRGFRCASCGNPSWHIPRFDGMYLQYRHPVAV
jgi:hypothetical protein